MFLLTVIGFIAVFVLGSCVTSILMRDNILFPDAWDKTPLAVYGMRNVLMILCVLLFIAWCVVTAL